MGLACKISGVPPLPKIKKNFNRSLLEEVAEFFFRGSFSCCFRLNSREVYTF